MANYGSWIGQKRKESRPKKREGFCPLLKKNHVHGKVIDYSMEKSHSIRTRKRLARNVIARLK